MGVFCDVLDTSGYRPYIEAIYAAGVTAGCLGEVPCTSSGGDLNFCPTNNITNAESIVFIIRGLRFGDPPVDPDITFEGEVGTDNKTNVQLFSDTEATTTLGYGYLQEAAKYGILAGPERNPSASEGGTPDFGATLIIPTTNTTRAQMANWIVRALIASGSVDFIEPAKQYFADVSSSHVYYTEIGRLFELGITAGCTAGPLGNFCPLNPITRQEMAVFITRAFNIKISTSKKSKSVGTF